ncbi:MAG: site-specific integrase [Mesorhizobium sp.]|uniref:site-specific integrase n=1 Tax=Mesorhizobium sp. TaxID=1871066 RepID=UPI00121C60C2|nr:site-specific integrase [Mesorhizobium sp.]TIO79350.1 MAG: site-specific integrase [Mesorhizobium sp.]TIO85964.1 MAG: site-specific integrase [Mesorhizobium sp.]
MISLVSSAQARPGHYLSRLVAGSGERITLLKDAMTDLPVPWITRYCVGPIRTQGKAQKTIDSCLSTLRLVLQWGIERGIEIDARLDSIELFSKEETEDLIDWLGIGRATDKKRRLRKRVSGDTQYTRAMQMRQYFAWRAEHALHRISSSSGRYGDASRKLEDWKCLVGESVRGGGGKSTKKGLHQDLRPRLLEVIHPDFPSNPFERRHRKRNFALLLSYYKLGLRRGEALVLKGADLFLAGSRPRISVQGCPDDPEDPRPDQPSVKTADRVLYIDAVLRGAIEQWLTCRSDAKLYPGAKKQPFVFVAENGNAIAGRTVYDLFVIIREAFPEFPPDFSPHTLRHDWNDRFSTLCDKVRRVEAEQEIDPDLRLTDAREASMRNYLMGWKKGSNTGVRYTTRSTERRAQELNLQMQESLFNG